MDTRPLLFCLIAVIVSAVCGCPVGREFLTTFMTNYVKGSGNPQLVITAYENTARVTVWSPVFYRVEIVVPKGLTVTINLPAKIELSGSGKSNKIVRISSDSDITVGASNIEPFTGDGTVVLPTSHLGRRYVVFTPPTGHLDAVVAIVNGDRDNSVEILPSGKKISLKPYEVYQLTGKTFTGTRITSKLPLAVLAGHRCAYLLYTCEHVYEQLIPVERLSDHYLVPAMINRNTREKDYAYVLAADDQTTVTISGVQNKVHKLSAGQSLSIPMGVGESIIVTSNKRVMVMYLGVNYPYDEFLTNILPTSEMSNTWTLYKQPSFENRAVVISEDANKVSGVAKWMPFPADRRYVWGQMNLGVKGHHATISGKGLMAVYAVGGKARHGYGMPGACSSGLRPTPKPDPCDGITCREREECKKGVCVPSSEETCSALGDPHYKTFDGKRYDFQGTCTYTMAEVLKNINGLVPFTVLAKNNHRGNKWVSYVRKVTVTVYNHTVVIDKRRGRVEVDGEMFYLPVNLVGGKLKVAHIGRYAELKTDFGLKVMYDWNMMLRITVPSSYFSTLGGLCGNYNGNPKDEWTSRSGSLLPSALKFAKTWKVTDDDLFCHDNCRGRCPSCTSAQKKKYSAKKYCGLITDTNSVFASCISTVDPDLFFNNCVYDICINKGIRTFLCDNVENYVDECMSKGIKIDGWRNLANCPMDCPAHSHYEACGPACAASCAERAPSTCQRPCIEGCQCDTGFVLSVDKCVRETSCGCTYEGRYYPPGKKFWADKTCTKKCKCQSGNVQCSDTKCKSSEACSLRNGVRDCYPLSYATCWGSGDPHYRSFDGKKFDFQGTCTYYLSKLVNTTDPTVEPFEVQVQNENRGRNKAVAYTKTVLIKVYGHVIVFSSDTPGKVMLNNTFVNLPTVLEDGRLSILRRGWAGVVKTEFGLEVQFDWRSYVSVTLPNTYSGLVGGLCGNFNADRQDDMLTPSKTPAKNPTEFGKSWKVKDDPRCKDTCEGKNCPVCDIDAKVNEPYQKACSILTDKDGPFKDCHGKVDPKQYYDDCVYDMCMYQGHSSALCSALSTYTSVCQEAKVRFQKTWRTETLCPLPCKPNSHYELCPSSCSQMCRGTEEPENCESAPCREGCECDENFVLSNGQCVREEDCGCAHKGHYYQQGQVFFPGDQCEDRCECKDNGRVTCQSNFSCGPNEVCRIQGGTKGCFPSGKATCTVKGTGHYRSFDNKGFSVSGNCTYKMAEVVKDEDGKRIPFSVVIHQKSVPNDKTVSRSVQIQVGSYNIIMLSGRIWEVTLDGVTVNLPLQLDDVKLRAYHNGHVIILQTDFGLEVTYDTVSIVRVELPSSYKGMLLGLCGNYNGNPDDDFALPGGAQASSPEAFAKGWVVPQKGVKCETGCGSNCPTSPPTEEQKELCDILKDTKGPFSKCHATVPPQEYFDECVKDLSDQGGKKDVLCQHLQNYVSVCQESGASVDSWRNETFCPMKCPKNSQYALCADTCSTTCASLTTSQKCSHCQEGCECEDGFAFDGGACTTLGKCGCVVDGRYYKSGETVINEDCKEKCSCVDGVFSCKETECTTEQVCTLREGVRNCYEEDPCEAKKCLEKEKCVKTGNTVQCVAESKASCWVMGDPHYRSFDGKLFSFQGTCTYTLVEAAGLVNRLTDFSIVITTELEHLHRVAYLQTVTLTVDDSKIVVVFGTPGKVLVDGDTVTLPHTLKSGKIRIEQKNNRGFIKTDFGLELAFSWGRVLQVTVPSSYYKNLKGMCGNYNGNETDDFSLPLGTVVTSVKKWAEAWSLPETNSSCLHSSCQGNCRTCRPEDEEQYKESNFCGEIGKKNGAFSACHAKVQPEKLLDDCLDNMCIHDGNKKMLCKVMANYAKICQGDGAEVSKQWLQTLDC